MSGSEIEFKAPLGPSAPVVAAREPVFRIPPGVRTWNDLKIDDCIQAGAPIVYVDDNDENANAEALLYKPVILPKNIYAELKQEWDLISWSATADFKFEDRFKLEGEGEDKPNRPKPRPISQAEINGYRRFFNQVKEYNAIKEGAALEDLPYYVISRMGVGEAFEYLAGSEGTVRGPNSQWSFPLVYERATSDNVMDQPYSDLRLEFNELPVIICKFDSDVQNADMERMIVQGAGLAQLILRLAKLADQPHASMRNHVMVMAIYFQKKPAPSQAHRWMFHARTTPDGSSKIHIFRPSGPQAPARQYGMDLAADVFRLLFNLYNWHEYLQNVPYKGGGDSWKVLKHQLIKFARDQTSFHALKSAKPNAKGSASRKRPRISETEMKEEEADNEAIPAEKVTPFEELLVGRGITLDKVDYRLGGFPHLAHARRSGEVVVVKLTCRKEVEIHRLLSPAPNVVPLFDVIPTPTDSLLVITPLRVPLTIIHQNTAPLMLGLLDGVSFLHNSHIAHLDIRPQNLVVHKPDWRLEIIDFDLAVQASFDDLVEGFQGVEAWVAPEVGKAKYSPFRADAWATGKVIQWYQSGFTEPLGQHLIGLAAELTNTDPSQRPHRIKSLTPSHIINNSTELGRYL